MPAHFRSTFWLHATHPDAAPLRAWIDQSLGGLQSSVAKSLLSRLHDERRYTQALAEIATAHALRRPGYTVEFEPDLHGLTPDLLVIDPSGRRLIVEIWRRGLPKIAVSRNKQWGLLACQVRRIPVALDIAVDSTSHDVVEPPDASVRRDLAPVLRRWLTAWQPGDIEALTHAQFVFRIVGTSTTGHVEMLPVRNGATAGRKDVVEAIERKVKRYRARVIAHDIPFVVVLSADEDTAMDVALVQSILDGKNAMAMNLPCYGVGAMDSGTIELRRSEAPPQFDPMLSGVGWLEINDGAHARVDLIWTNPAARWPVEPVPEEDAG